MATIKRISGALNKALASIAGCMVAIIMLMVVSDVTGRYLFRKPVIGTGEISELLMVSIVFLAIGYVQHQKGHIRVSVLTSLFSVRKQSALLVLAHFIALFYIGFMGWRNIIFGLRSMQIGETAMGLIAIPLWPFKLIIGIGCGLFCFELVLDILSDLYNLHCQR